MPETLTAIPSGKIGSIFPIPEPIECLAEYFKSDLPATHPLIGNLPVDTLNNTRNALCTPREFSETPGFAPKQDANSGFYSLMTCIIDALDFELHGREQGGIGLSGFGRQSKPMS